LSRQLQLIVVAIYANGFMFRIVLLMLLLTTALLLSNNSGLGLYFGAGQLVGTFIRRLKAIEAWFVNQNSYCFIASSLLFIYDSEAVYRRSKDAMYCVNGAFKPGDELYAGSVTDRTESCRSSASFDSNNNYDDIADVRIIDLTHVFQTTGPDINYMTGLRSLISYLTKLEKCFADRQ
jgi:Inositol polyphosphate kinase